MKSKKRIILVFAFGLIIWGIFFSVDSIRAHNNKDPVFAIYTAGYEDGGSKRFTGLFYNVYNLHYENPQMDKGWLNEDGTIKEEFRGREYITGVEVVPWFYGIDRIKKDSF